MNILIPWAVKPKILVKSEEGTNLTYGCFPEERPIQNYLRNGIINLDKPPGPTSHEVVAWVKRILKIERAGHGGTLEA